MTNAEIVRCLRLLVDKIEGSEIVVAPVDPVEPPPVTPIGDVPALVVDSDKLMLRPNQPNRYLTPSALKLAEALSDAIGKRIILQDASTLSGQPFNHPIGFHVAGHDFDFEYPANDEEGKIADVSQELNRLHPRDLYTMLMVVLKWSPKPRYIYINDSVMPTLFPLCNSEERALLMTVNVAADHRDHVHIST